MSAMDSERRPVNRAGIISGYGLVAVGVIACWALGSAPMVAVVVLIGAALTAVLYADFLKFRATGPGGFLMEAERQATRVEEALLEVEETIEVSTEELASESVDSSSPDQQQAVSKPAIDLPAVIRTMAENAKEREAERRGALERLVREASELGAWVFKVLPSQTPSWLGATTESRPLSGCQIR